MTKETTEETCLRGIAEGEFYKIAPDDIALRVDISFDGLDCGLKYAFDGPRGDRFEAWLNVSSAGKSWEMFLLLVADSARILGKQARYNKRLVYQQNLFPGYLESFRPELQKRETLKEEEWTPAGPLGHQPECIIFDNGPCSCGKR